MNLPNHIVVIPDGNRRWAKNKGLKIFLGHEEGAKKLEEILSAAFELKIRHLTFWGSSLDNVVKRTKEEVDFLFVIFEKYFTRLLNDKKIEENKVKISILGKWQELFPPKLKDIFNRIIAKTENYDDYHLTFLMAYDGRDEMIEAIKKVAELKTENPGLKIDSELIKKNLWSAGLPAVDLVIRTAGEPHWSAGLMMWDMTDTQLYFTETLWPDFGKEEFKKAIADFSSRQRRFGA